MRIYLIAIVFLVALHCFGEEAENLPDTNTVTNIVRMTMSLEKGGSVTNNQIVKLAIAISNSSSNKTFLIGVPMSPEENSGFSFSVISPTGRDIAKPPSFRVSKGGNGVFVKPGKEKKLEVNLRNVCTFDKPGIYRIVAKRKILIVEDDKEIEVESQPFSLSVVSGK